MIPGATYRLQFHKDFPFESARPLGPYLKRLGITHVYSSPILKARPGSMHGYDVTDPSIINPELGGESGFRQLAATLREHGLGIILDIVPNHMAVHADNAWWMDVLENGRASRFADYFDIEWDMVDGKVLMAVLGKPYWEALQAGEVTVRRNASGKLCACYFDREFPIRPEDQNADPNDFTGADSVHALLERQHYRLAWWRTANDIINWRRFFDVSDLVALKQENDDVFAATHAKVFDLYREGLIDGVRVDHVDGLADPKRYCRTLRATLDALAESREVADTHPYIVVEKILGEGEALPDDWEVDGTTGYDFMNQVSALQHEQSGAEPLKRFWHEISGRTADFEVEEVNARSEIAQSSFESALNRTAQLFHEQAQQSLESRDITAASFRRALVHLLQHLRVYRTYQDQASARPSPQPQFAEALQAARNSAGGGDQPALNFIAEALAAAGPERDAGIRQLARRFNQLSAPVAAKSVEDTAFYRYGALLSRNDVGFNPSEFATSTASFHHDMQRRQESFPHALLATATHDHKRGEDVRARLAVISEIPEEWFAAVRSWFALNETVRPPSLDRGDEYQLYQTLAGAWAPDQTADDADALSSFAERVTGWRQKALREAKLRSSWLDPNEAYEEADRDFIRAILDPQRSPQFLSSLSTFVGRIAYAGALNALVQTLLRCTVPGIPDCYQGAEFWDFSLVDPDNRRAVDYNARMKSLTAEGTLENLLASWRDGRVKQVLMERVLNFRQEKPELFAAGAYIPLEVRGPRAGNVIAFARSHGDDHVVAAAPLHWAELWESPQSDTKAFWYGTTVVLPETLNERDWRDLFSGAALGIGSLDCSSLFQRFPLALLT